MPANPESPFEKWAEGEGIPIVRGYYVPNAYEVKLEHWKRKGGRGALVILEGGEGFSAAYICEIPPRTTLKPQRHLFEETMYVLGGQGQTKFWNEGGPVQTISWQEYSVFSPPLNVWHQHLNTSDRPAKYVAVTNAPLVLNTYRNADFVFGTNYNFKDRYDGEPDYFDGVGKKTDPSTWRGGFVPDVRKMEQIETPEYGKGLNVLQLRLSGNAMNAHLAQIEVGTYKKPHRHSAGAHLIILDGEGFALMWEDWDKRVKANFRKGTIYTPGSGWWHTHGNTGTKVVQQVALRCDMQGIGHRYRTRLGIKHGGDMMERDDEFPEIRQLFEAELAKKGLKSKMDSVM